MRKTLSILLATTFLTCVAEPARAEPISTTIGLTAIISSIGVSTAVAGAVGGAIVSVAVSVGANLLINALLPEAPTPQEERAASSKGSTLAIQYGGALPRQAIMGPGASGGHHVYSNVYGSENDMLQAVFVVGDGLHGELTKLWYNGKECTLVAPLGPGPIGDVVEEFRVTVKGVTTDHVWVRWFNGADDQAADAELVATANPAGRWTTNHRGRGVCYLSITQRYNEEIGLVSVPQVLIEHEGLCLYDFRLDDTNGGSGPHRFGEPDTYEPSANPAVQEYNYRRGISVNSQRLLGMTVSATDLLLPMYVAAANACDEDVPLLLGGTELRYRSAVGLSDDRQHSHALESLRGAMAGFTLERAGQFGPIAGVAQTPITELTVTDDDLEVGTPAPFSKYRSRSEVATAVHGTYSDPDQKWASVAFPAREDPADDTIYGEKLARSLDLTQVYSSSQAQRIAEITRRRTLQLGRGSLTLGAKWIAVQPGDWLPFESARHGDMTLLVTGVRIDTERHNVTVSYERIASSVYTWTTAGEEDAPAVPTGGQPGTITLTAAGMTATGISVPGEGGLVEPAIHFTWTGIGDPAVNSIQFEIHKQGDTTIIPFVASFPGSGTAVARGVQAGTTYEYRHQLTTTPVRDCPWVDGVAPVVAGADHVVPNALAALALDLQGFQARVIAWVADELAAGSQARDRAEQMIGQAAFDHDASGLIENYKRKADVHVVRTEIIQTANTVLGTNYASLTEVSAVYAGTTEAFAVRELDLAAALAQGPYANLTAAFTTFVDNDEGFGEFQIDIETGLLSHFANVTLGMQALTTLDQRTNEISGVATAFLTLNVNDRITGFRAFNDGVQTSFDIEADFFRVGKTGVSGGSFIPVFQVATVTGIGSTMTLRGDFIADGMITAPKVTTGELIALSAQLGSLIVTNAKIGNLEVDTHKIGNNAVTSVAGWGASSTTLTNSFQLVASATVNFTATAGSLVTVSVSGVFESFNSSVAQIRMQLDIDGSALYTTDFTATLAVSTTFPIIGAKNITATGGSQNVVVDVYLRDFGTAGTAVTVRPATITAIKK